MPKLTKRLPKYSRHRASGRAVVTLNGKDCYLGRYGSQASRDEYDQLTAQWLANGRKLPGQETSDSPSEPETMSVSELLIAYWRFAKKYYVKDGKPTSELSCIKLAMKMLKANYGRIPAVDFGPLKLMDLREKMIQAGHARNTINQSVGRIRRIFKFGVSREVVPASVHEGLRTVPGLRRGRSGARETSPVKPVSRAFVDAIKPYVSRQVWAMVELQWLTGMRSGEVTIMRGCDIDTSGTVWFYRPPSHKTIHHGHERTIDLGPKAQEVILQFLKADISAYLFSPTDAVKAQREDRRRHRKTPLYSSHKKRRRSRRNSQGAGDFYSRDSYRRAVARGCDCAFPPPAPLGRRENETKLEWKNRLDAEQKQQLDVWRKAHRWHPHRLRHAAATRFRKEFGLETARMLLGHRKLATTEIYAEMDHEKMRGIVAKIG